MTTEIIFRLDECTNPAPLRLRALPYAILSTISQLVNSLPGEGQRRVDWDSPPVSRISLGVSREAYDFLIEAGAKRRIHVYGRGHAIEWCSIEFASMVVGGITFDAMLPSRAASPEEIARLGSGNLETWDI